MKPGAFGKYAVDYEMRVDYDRLRRERVERARDQINKRGLGALITWDEAMKSKHVVAPERYALDADPPTMPDADGRYPMPVPGVTKFA